MDLPPTAAKKPTIRVMVGLHDFLQEEEIDGINRIIDELRDRYNVREHRFDPSEGLPDNLAGVEYVVIKGSNGTYCRLTPEEADRLLKKRNEETYQQQPGKDEFILSVD